MTPRSNPEAYEAWLVQLERKNWVHNEPLRWIQEMLRTGPRQRITAHELLHKIRSYQDHENDIIYCGHCCTADESDLSSVCRSSITPAVAEVFVRARQEHLTVPDGKKLIDHDQASRTVKKLSDKVEVESQLEREHQSSRSGSPQKGTEHQPAHPERNISLSSYSPETNKMYMGVPVQIQPEEARIRFSRYHESAAKVVDEIRRIREGILPTVSPQAKDGEQEHLWLKEVNSRFDQISDYFTERQHTGSQTDAAEAILCQSGGWFRVRETPLNFLGQKVTPEQLCAWILENCAQCFDASSEELHVATSLCTLLVAFSFSYATAGACVIDFLMFNKSKKLTYFGRRGRKIRETFEGILRKGETAVRDRSLENISEAGNLPVLEWTRRDEFLKEMFGAQQRNAVNSILETMSRWHTEFTSDWLAIAVQIQDQTDIDIETSR
jgi:hypothetical protein